MTPLDAAIILATWAHSNQLDEDGSPHILHSLAVAAAVLAVDLPDGYTRGDLVKAAILHDAVEDGGVSIEDIQVSFGVKVASTVDAVSRRINADGSKESYRDFVYRAKQHPAGRIIKIADLHHNMSRTHLIGDDKEKWRKKLEYKYAIAERVLNNADEPTWEEASREWIDGKAFVADPNGKRIEVETE